MIVNQLFQTIASVSQNGIWITDSRYQTIFACSLARKMMELTHYEDPPPITRYFPELNNQGEQKNTSFPQAHRVVFSMNKTKLIAVNRFPLPLNNEELILWELTDLEHNNDKWSELKKIDSTNSSLFEDSPIPIWDEDFSMIKKRIDTLKSYGVKDIKEFLQGNKQELKWMMELLVVNGINQAVVDINEAKSKEQVLDHFRSLTTEHSNEYLLTQMEAIANGKTSCEFDAELITFKGNKRYVHFKWIVVRGCEETYKQVFLTTTDLTERIKEENIQLQRSNREKETLLKEIHHRVKNNLQIISSLVRLQARNEDNEEVKAILDVTLSRILSIANVHELLYKSNELASIDFNGYSNTLLQSLIDSMVNEQVIDYEITTERIKLPLEIAIPLGLILNELLTNSIKHGFVGRKNGHIDINLSRTPTEYILHVADDGVGIPPQKQDGSVDSLGLLLIESLTEQLNGSLERISNSNGTSYTIGFPISDNIFD